MEGPRHSRLSRRERQIMDILYRHGRAPASVVREELPGDPSSSTVRTQLRILEQKGHVRHEEVGLRYVYRPVTPRRTARRSALRHLVETFFDGSAEQAVAALLGGEAKHLTELELDCQPSSRTDRFSTLVGALAPGTDLFVLILMKRKISAVGAVGNRVLRGFPSSLRARSLRPWGAAASTAPALAAGTAFG